MLGKISLFSHSKDLLIAWTGRAIRGRYQQSLLGWFWAIIQPATSVLIFTIIFTRFVPVDTGDIPYVIFSYVAVVPWTFLSSSLTDMTNSLVQNMSLVQKIYFPREVLPVSAMLARLADFGVAAILVVILILIYQVQLTFLGILILPLIVLIQITLVLGMGLITSALNVFYRDVQPLLALGTQLWFYASPIIYPVTLVPENLRTFYYLNPMAGILEAYRDVILRGSTPGYYLWVSAGSALLILIGGNLFFKRVEHLFADIV